MMKNLKKNFLVLVTTTLLCCNLMPVGTAWAGSYQIKAGDTLQKIADKHEITVEALQTANRLNGTLIYAGDILSQQIRITVAMGKMAVVQLTLALMHSFSAGDNISATTQGRIPLNIFSMVGLSL